jgi:Permeases of the drug/metabolite transporter (DMT) superfamily
MTKEKMTNPIIVGSLAILCCLLWGSAFPCIKIGYEWFQIEDTGSQILFAGYRFFLAGILTFFLGSVLERKILIMKTKSVPAVFAQGVLQTTIQYFCFYIGMSHVTGAKGSIINASNAFVSILAAQIVFKNEKMVGKKWLGCLFGILGVVAVNFTRGAWGDGFTLQGEGMMVICAFAYGISSITLKMLSKRESAFTITAYQLLFGGALLFLIGKGLGGRVEGFTISSTLLLFYMAFISTIAFSLWATLLKYNPVGKVAVYTFSIPIFGVMLSGLFLGETILSWRNLIALLLVSAGIILINKSDKK